VLCEGRCQVQSEGDKKTEHCNPAITGVWWGVATQRNCSKICGKHGLDARLEGMTSLVKHPLF
jgi:hypothetical protein